MYTITENKKIIRDLKLLEHCIIKLSNKYRKLTARRLRLYGTHNWKQANVNHHTARKILNCEKVSFESMVNTNRKISSISNPRIRMSYAITRGIKLPAFSKYN